MSYFELETCRFCDGKISSVIHLGDNFPLAGGFMKEKNQIVFEKLFPLSLSLCERCSILQCLQVINPDLLFKQGYFYYSSTISTLVSHFSKLAEHIVSLYGKCTIIELGCNDGVLLKPLKNLGCNVIGIDPSNTVNDLIENKFEIYNDYISETVVNNIIEKHGKCDVFVSANSFAHIHDMKTVFNCMKKILKDDGTAIIEVHNAKHILIDFHFDFIYHEHCHYFTVTSFEKIGPLFGFTLVDIENIPTHGGSIRVYLKKGKHNKTEKLRNVLDEEKKLNLEDINLYKNFSIRLLEWKNNFQTIVSDYKNQNYSIYGYGSSGRANIICTFSELYLDEIFDDSQHKIGSITPLYHQEIKSLSSLIPKNKDIFIILAWPYKNIIIEKIENYYKNNNMNIPIFIIPLPYIKIIECNK